MQATAIDSGTQFVTLGLDREVFAVDVAVVREILDIPTIARLPNAPGFLLGLIELRGQPVPVIDLRLKLGLPAATVSDQTRIVVLDILAAGRRLLLGLQADRVFEVTALDGTAVEPPPDIGVRWRSDYISGIGRRGDSFVIIFDLARLLGSDEVALLTGDGVATEKTAA